MKERHSSTFSLNKQEKIQQYEFEPVSQKDSWGCNLEISGTEKLRNMCHTKSILIPSLVSLVEKLRELCQDNASSVDFPLLRQHKIRAHGVNRRCGIFWFMGSVKKCCTSVLEGKGINFQRTSQPRLNNNNKNLIKTK